MTDEIKLRIGQINRGEVPPGYKKTEVGVVPQEWEETTLSELFVFKNGLNKEKEAFGNGTPIVNYTDVWKKRGLKASDVNGKVTLTEKEIENYNVKKGDVFFTRTSETKEEIGLSSVLLEDIENGVFSGFVLRARPKNEKIYPPYNQYCYSSALMRYEVIKKSSITTRALTSGVSLGQVQINIPSYEEQQRISEILSKWDEAIALQEKLIESISLKKKSISQKIFSNLNGNIELKLGDICSITTGGLDANAMSEKGKYPFFTCSKEVFSIDEYAFDTEALLIAGNGDIGNIKYYDGKFNAYQRTYVLTDFKYPIKYIKYYLENNLMKEISGETQKSSMPYIKLGTLKNITINYDERKCEQIIKILDGLNEIINKEKDIKEKLISQQKAMHRMLLTGVLRVLYDR